MSEIQKLEAMEIFDSRGNPTLAVTATLSSGVSATAKIPSGASTGTREVIELRDGDKSRYQGKGVLKACGYVEGEIQKEVIGMNVVNQASWTESFAIWMERRTRHAWAPTQFLVCPCPSHALRRHHHRGSCSCHGRRADQDRVSEQGERVAKYNRLLAIERELGNKALYARDTVYERWGRSRGANASRLEKGQAEAKV